jgi:hypothetical protein
MSFWDDLGGIISGVGVIADGLSGILSETDSPQPYSVGSVNFFAQEGNIYAQNLDPDSGVVLNFAQSTVSIDPTTGASSLGTATSPVVLDVSGSGVGAIAVVGPEIQSMLGGTLAMSAFPSSSSGNPIGTAIGFSICAIGVATAINIVGGITAGFSKAPDGSWQFSIMSTGPSLASASVSVRAPDGTKAQMNMAFQSQEATGSTGTVEVPPGVNIHDTIAELDITLEVAASSAESFLDNLRKNTRRPPKAQAAA